MGRRVVGQRGLRVALLISSVILLLTAGRGICSEEQPRPAQETIATVNGEPLLRGVFDRAFLKIAEQNVRFGPGLPLERMWSYRLEALSQAVDEQLVSEEARAHNLTVSAGAIDAALDEIVNEYLAQIGNQGDERETQLAKICAQLGGPVQPKMSEGEFRLWLHDWLRSRYLENVTAALRERQLRAEVVPLSPVSEQDLRTQYETVTLHTIALRRREAERLEEAEHEVRERGEELLRQIRAGADFAALAATASDDESYKETSGLEGAVLLSSLHPERRKAVLSLKVGEVSELLKTDLGYELVRVEARGYDIPADYEERKPQLQLQLAAERQEQDWQAYMKTRHDEASIVVTDPELLAYTCLREGKAEEALALLEKAAQESESLGPAGAASVFFQLAAHYSLQNRWEEAAQAYASADHYILQVLTLFPDARVATLLGLGHSYENLYRQLREQQSAAAEAALTKAVQYYQEAGQHNNSLSHHDRLRLAYMRLGREDLAEQEEAWLEGNKGAAEASRRTVEEAQKEAAEETGKSR